MKCNQWPWSSMSKGLAMSLALACAATVGAQERPGVTTPTITTDPPERVVVIPPERVHRGWQPYPMGAQNLTEEIPLNTIHMYKSTRFRSDRETIENVTNVNPGGSNEVKGGLDDSLSSLRWNLPPGVVVVFYEDAGAKGEQLAVWGKGEMNELSRWNFNDKASSWAWYYAGGAEGVTMEMERAAIVFPTGTVVIAREVPVIEPGTFKLYRNKNFDGDAVALADVTQQESGRLHELPSDMNNAVTSLRWNLPPGVVVTFYQGTEGNKQQAAVWGNGEVRDIDVWDLNDKISRWTWAYIGSPPSGEPLGYTPPRTTTIIVEGDRDAMNLITREMRPTELGVTPNDLRARRNPSGEGTFVYVPKTQFDGIERHVMWMVVDSRAFAISGPAKLITPDLPSVAEAGEAFWAATGLSPTQPEVDAVKILFND